LQIKVQAALVLPTPSEGKFASVCFSGDRPYEHPVVLPHVSHFMHVPFRTRVKLPHSVQASPS
jgi:hypothetical protein